jgi:hypothetical protein
MGPRNAPESPLATLRSPEAAVCFAAHGVMFASLFGSHARGEATGRSEVDVAVRHPVAGAGRSICGCSWPTISDRTPGSLTSRW